MIVILAGGVGGWAATTEISGALIAPGSIVVDSNVKKVQHPTGGVVGELRVRDGDRVKAGDIVVRLDETVTRANLAIVSKGLNELMARKARLEAERDSLEAIKFPGELARSADHDAEAGRVLAAEQKLFDLRRSARAGQKAQLRQRIGQLRQEIAGLNAQQSAKTREVSLIERELDGVRDLFKRNLIQINRLTALEREATRLEGERGQLIAAVAQANGKITELELQIIQIDQDLSSEVAQEMRDIDAKIGEFVERKVTAEDQLRRVDIRAPQDGIVFQSSVHTVGGVITAGDAIMMIVPDADNLTVEAKVNPQDIDQLQIGQIRAAAFLGLQSAHHAGNLRHGHPHLGRYRDRPAHRAELLHDPHRHAAEADRAPRRRTARARHAGGNFRADRRAHGDIVSDQAALRSDHAHVSGKIMPAGGAGHKGEARAATPRAVKAT